MLEILINLIGNAIKYTNEGSVSVGVSRSGARGVRFEVRDTGIGIPAEDIERIFDRHHRVDGHRAAYAGTGLGLAIVRDLVEVMGGTLGVESVVGKGSLFWIELPLGDDSNAAAVDPGTSAVNSSRKSVLVADDLRANRTLVEHILTANGYDVVCVENGVEAVNAVKTIRFDMVFMDLNMPIVDGGAAAAAIRALPGPLCRVPIIALSADDFASVKDRSKALGMNDVLPKPFKVDDLLRIAAKWCAQESAPAT